VKRLHDHVFAWSGIRRLSGPLVEHVDVDLSYLVPSRLYRPVPETELSLPSCPITPLPARLKFAIFHLLVARLPSYRPLLAFPIYALAIAEIYLDAKGLGFV
jgi:hypothetical protein